MARGVAVFCVGLWVMGTVSVSVVATQNFYTIDRLLADAGHPRFDELVEQIGDVEARDFLRYVSSELNRLFFQYWNYTQFLIGGVTMWLVVRLPDGASLKWPVGVMLAILVLLTFAVTPPDHRDRSGSRLRAARPAPAEPGHVRHPPRCLYQSRDDQGGDRPLGGLPTQPGAGLARLRLASRACLTAPLRGGYTR